MKRGRAKDIDVHGALPFMDAPPTPVSLVGQPLTREVAEEAARSLVEACEGRPVLAAEAARLWKRAIDRLFGSKGEA